MTIRPSRIVEQMRGIPLFVGKGSSTCSVCGRPLTAHESVVRGIGPVCVRKHYGPGPHPSGSPQSVHAGRRGKRKSLEELSRARPISIKHAGTGIEHSHIADFGKEGKALVKTSTFGSADSELMAYEFSKSIGWGIVPETIKTGRETTMQRWVEGQTAMEVISRRWPTRKPGEKEPIPSGPGFGEKASRIIIMDTLLQNTDRHLSNILIDEKGKQWAIDNNMAFMPSHPEGQLSYRHYGPMKRFGLRLPRADVLEAAKDVRRWFRAPAYHKYLAKLESTHGKKVSRQFELNVADLAIWSRRAKVMK